MSAAQVTVLIMTRWIRARGSLFWAVVGSAVLVGVLFAASQIAHNRGQSVDWYTGFGQWLGALGSFVAAGAALWIATRDREDRKREREDADLAQARLVQVEVVQARNEFTVRIHNYGDRAIIGAAVTDAWWFAHPEYTWDHIGPDRVKVVTPNRDGVAGESVWIAFVDAERSSVPEQLSIDNHGNPRFEKVTPPPDVLIAFMDANGSLWETGSATLPRRLDKAPVKWH